MNRPLNLDELERRLAEATPGPWDAEVEEYAGTDCWTLYQNGHDFPLAVGFIATRRDAPLVVALRNEASALIAELRASRGVVTAARELLARMDTDHLAGSTFPLLTAMGAGRLGDALAELEAPK